jgi:hypothetical protein
MIRQMALRRRMFLGVQEIARNLKPILHSAGLDSVLREALSSGATGQDIQLLPSGVERSAAPEPKEAAVGMVDVVVRFWRGLLSSIGIFSLTGVALLSQPGDRSCMTGE